MSKIKEAVVVIGAILVFACIPIAIIGAIEIIKDVVSNTADTCR